VSRASGVPSGPDLLAFAEEVCRSYRERGYEITLRQLYYQGVARGFLQSGSTSYEALKRVVSKARLEGRSGLGGDLMALLGRQLPRRLPGGPPLEEGVD
jgi:hypothetical protein